MSPLRLLSLMALGFAFLSAPVLAQSPVFVTQTPTIGNSANTFFVFLPVANIGNGEATNMQLTSVTLNHLGAPATTTLQPATLPIVTGSGYLGPTGVRTLDLEFDNTRLVTGNTYLLTLRGTYQVGGTTLGFALNRPVVYVKGFVATHQQVLDAIAMKFQARPRIDPNADNQALLAFAKGLPQISAAGVGATSSLVWAQFADTGRKLVILNNILLPAQPITSSANVPPSAPAADINGFTAETSVRPVIADQLTGAPTEIPQSIKARLLNGLGSGLANAVPDIHAWLVGQQGYSDPIGADASVTGLRSVGGDGVLYISSHGGADAADDVPYDIWTSTPTTDACLPPSTTCPDPLLPGDILNGLVGEYEADNQYDPATQEYTTESHYGIRTKFVSTYWHNFDGNAFVFIDTCDSDKNDPTVVDFKNALILLKASVYAGWTDEVRPQLSADSARLVFDRLVGADQYCPETSPDAPITPCVAGPAPSGIFPQRPFDYPQVMADLPLHQLGKDVKLGGQLMFEPLAGSFGLLAPSISNMQMQEFNGVGGQLTINGIFGQNPGTNGSVQVGGMDAKIESWGVNAIVVDLNLSGPGSAGDVQVKVRGHKSNVARLTEWRADPFTYTITGNGSLRLTANFTLHFRLDMRKFREQIHFPPSEPSGGSLASDDSTGTYSASGSGPGIGETFNWSGSGTLVYATKNIPLTGLNIFEATAQIVDTTHLKSSVGAASEANAGGVCTVIVPMAPPQVSPLPVEGPSNLAVLIGTSQIWFFDFALDPDSADILPNQASASGVPPVSSYVFCMDDTQTAKYTFQWTRIPATPDTAPDPESAR
jgi:hypothetical protein